MVADLVMEVRLRIDHEKVARIYELPMKLKETEFVSLEDTHRSLQTGYLKELEDAIENHIIFLSKVSGITNLKSSSRSEASDEIDEDDSSARTQEDIDDNAEDDDRGDDLGSDVQKRKQQSTDEMDYDDGSDVDHGEDELSADRVETLADEDDFEDTKTIEKDEIDDSDDRVEDPEAVSEGELNNLGGKTTPEEMETSVEGSSSDKKKQRAIYLKLEGLHFEVHFKFTTEPHLLLAQIAQKAAKKVYIKKAGRISQCKMVQYDPDEKTVIWDDKKKPKKGDSGKDGEDNAYWAVKASGIDFKSFWEMQDDLDLTRLYSNSIHAMLNAYGVEAARATIIREVKHVFDIYGVKIDFRHLSLIADYMTHTGGYRPMSRHGSISESLSPFLKMSFETASKFIVEAASYGLTDNLETPSSRICLGLPVKMGTGGFDLMQKLDI